MGLAFRYVSFLLKQGKPGDDVLMFLLLVFALLQVFPGGCEVSWERCDTTAEAVTRG